MAHVVLSGGHSRVARDVTQVLLRFGHKITLLDIIPIENSTNTFFVECDLQKPETFNKVVDKIIDGEFGEIDALVNLARMRRSPGLIKRFTEDLLKEWRETFDIQVFAPYFLTIEIAKNEKNKNQLKSVVNVSSILSHSISTAESASYQSSKAALESISRILAGGLGESQVRVNSISLGYIENKLDSKDASNSELINQILDSIRIFHSKLESTDVGNILNFLISPESIGISGQTIVVDQGLGILETLEASVRSVKTFQPKDFK